MNDIYRLDMMDEWINAAYDENGDAAICDICAAEMRWNSEERFWYCPECGRTMNRESYFDHIGAQPPGSGCLADCRENYPFCKKTCDRYPIDPGDPMLT